MWNFPAKPRRIAEIARRLKTLRSDCFACQSEFGGRGAAMRMGGRSAPFGIDEEDLDEVLDLVLSLPTLDFRGIHLFSGTQILDPNILATQYRKGIAIARKVAQRLSTPLANSRLWRGTRNPILSA